MKVQREPGSLPAALRSGLVWGAVAGIGLVATMYVVSPLAGVPTLPQSLQDSILRLTPGPVFGILIDSLQHAGKVLEEIGLIVSMVGILAIGGAVSFVIAPRFPSPAVAPTLVAIAGWVAVVAVWLPALGAGPLGLNQGRAAPLVWALLFLVYDGVLTARLSDPASFDADRRRYIFLMPTAVVAVSVIGLASRLWPEWYSGWIHPPEASAGGLPPEITPRSKFYVVSKNFNDPVVSANTWRLTVVGLVHTEVRLDLKTLQALPSSHEVVTLECISNPVGGPLMSTGRFTGPSLRDVIALANPMASVTDVGFRARDGYTETFPMSLIRGAPEILVAHSLDDLPLPLEHGFPARLVIPGHYGMKGPKWLEQIELRSSALNGYWEDEGWDRQAIVKTTARIDVPQQGADIRSGSVHVGGVAFAGTRGISAVEWTSNGRNWLPAALHAPVSPLSWVVWEANWDSPRNGAYTLRVRARDGSGDLQSSTTVDSFPNGSGGYHSVSVRVGG